MAYDSFMNIEILSRLIFCWFSNFRLNCVTGDGLAVSTLPIW